MQWTQRLLLSHSVLSPRQDSRSGQSSYAVSDLRVPLCYCVRTSDMCSLASPFKWTLEPWSVVPHVIDHRDSNSSSFRNMVTVIYMYCNCLMSDLYIDFLLNFCMHLHNDSCINPACGFSSLCKLIHHNRVTFTWVGVVWYSWERICIQSNCCEGHVRKTAASLNSTRTTTLLLLKFLALSWACT
jgi:hypothetical protein